MMLSTGKILSINSINQLVRAATRTRSQQVWPSVGCGGSATFKGLGHGAALQEIIVAKQVRGHGRSVGHYVSGEIINVVMMEIW